MRLSQYKQESYELSGKASDVTRTAALAGIGIVWVFRTDPTTVPAIPQQLLTPLLLFAAALAADLLHYVVGAMIWGTFHRYHESRLTDPGQDPKISHPFYLAYPIFLFFYSKIAFSIAGYTLLGRYLFNVWFSAPAQIPWPQSPPQMLPRNAPFRGLRAA